MLISLKGCVYFYTHPGHGSYIQITILFVRDERHLILRQVLEDDGNKHIDVVRTRDDDRNLETCFQQRESRI